jgi:hypothetical protein
MDKTQTLANVSQTQTSRQFTDKPRLPLNPFWDVAPPFSSASQKPKNPKTRPSVHNSVLLIILLLLALEFPRASAATPTKPTPNQLTREQIAEGWISLFDGETLFGWTPTSGANWKVEDGAITVSEGEEGFLATNAEFADYELHVDFKATPTTNSGVFLRTPIKPTDPTKDCIELNIAPRNNPFPTGSIVGRSRLNAMPRSESRSNPEIDPWDGHWHTFHIVIGDEKLGKWIDGRYASHALLSTKIDRTPAITPRRGRISLQFREGSVAFRNIRLKPLGLKPMFNGPDLKGWNTNNVEASKFEVVPPEDAFAPEAMPELHVTNGRGILETDASYGDFIMQLDAYVDGDGLNSGVFFRSIPREYANGYESQISNKIVDGDPTKPADFGTGAIYRRVPARRVVSKDREWFTKTIVATGPHIAVWVNGYQVTDWTDTRPPHDNPREGLRTKPGTISLQGHDPTTNLRFRKLKIAELPERTNHGGPENTENER